MGIYSFFDESREQSKIKAKIVTDYLWVWAKVVIPTTRRIDNKIAYIDLFAGPGRYKDGTKSTPLLVLEKAINDPDMRNMLVSIFSDADPENSESLKQVIESTPNINILKYKPQVYSEIVDESITNIFESTKMIPSLTFLDPWGYKGLSCRLINSVIKDWGCDCIIFFNYNRINMGLGNKSVEQHMNVLFGNECADKLRAELPSLSPPKREVAILCALSDTLKDLGGKYVLPFRFRGGKGDRISHHLIFVSKHVKGYDIMKYIMAKTSSSDLQGVPSFEYSPTITQPYLLPPYLPLDQLKSELLDTFQGKSLSVLDIYNQHNVGTYYIKNNYKQALLQLEMQGDLGINPSAEKRPKRAGETTLGDKVIINFPKKKE